MSRAIEFYIVDIFIASDKINRYCSPFDNAQSLLHSELEWDAVIRELEIIGEATNKLLQHEVIDSQYRMIVDFRNQIAHGYFGIDENIVWEVASTLLDDFLDELSTLIRTRNISLSETIDAAQKDHHYNSKTLHFLDTISKKYP